MDIFGVICKLISVIGIFVFFAFLANILELKETTILGGIFGLIFCLVLDITILGGDIE